jgi:hypothetical protein
MGKEQEVQVEEVLEDKVQVPLMQEQQTLEEEVVELVKQEVVEQVLELRGLEVLVS